MMANLVAKSGDNKGQFPNLVEAICRDFRKHDKAEEDRYLAWQRLKNTKGDNKDKPEEPIVAYLFPPVDTTKPAFLKNAIGHLHLRQVEVLRSTTLCLEGNRVLEEGGLGRVNRWEHV